MNCGELREDGTSLVCRFNNWITRSTKESIQRVFETPNDELARFDYYIWSDRSVDESYVIVHELFPAQSLTGACNDTTAVSMIGSVKLE